MEKTILIFTRYYLPGYKAGGPIRSVANLVRCLGERFHFKIVTSDRDLSDTKPYPDIYLNEWTKQDGADVFYMQNSPSFSQIRGLIKSSNADLISLNSFFDFRYSILPVLVNRFVTKKTILLTPRGEFSEGAIQIKPVKKKWFIRTCRWFGLYKNVHWSVSNEHEKRDLLKYFDVQDAYIHLTPNLPANLVDEKLPTVKKEVNNLKVVFLSRISPKKNLEFVIDTFSEITEHTVTLDLFGTIEDETYWQNLSSKIEKLPKNISVNYRGTVSHNLVNGTLQKYHLFFLPTKGENFGHAIYESMAAGTPVLISDQTPWINLEEKKLGWELPLSDRAQFRSVLRKIARMDQEQINNLKRDVYESIRERGLEQSVENNRETLSSLTS